MKVDIEGLSKAEKKHLISQFTLLELFKELHRRAMEDEEEELDEREEGDFKFESEDEAELACSLYISKYPHEVCRLFSERALTVPKWLQEEILERRVKKDA